MFITTPDGLVDIDSEIGRQDRYNRMMANVLKEKEMFQLEIDYIMTNGEFKTLTEIKPWARIALDAGAFIVAIWQGDKLFSAYTHLSKELL